MKYEGHMFMWFLTIMPAAKLNLPYPISIQIINLIFIWIAGYIFIKKAPLNILTKTLILFSFPMAYQYSVIARPYAMGIMFLFLLAMLFKDKLKYPYLYPILIILCANTSIMALFGAAAFGFMFLWDYLKEKNNFWKSKEFYIILTITLTGIGIILFQLLGAQLETNKYADVYLSERNIFSQLLYTLNSGLMLKNGYESTFSKLVPAGLCIILSLITFWKDKKSFFFFNFTYFMLFLLFEFVYKGYIWHHLHYYIYLIIAIWLFNANKTKQNIFYYLLMTIIIYMSLVLNYHRIIQYYYEPTIPHSINNNVVQDIIKLKNINQNNLVVYPGLTIGMVPYLNEQNYSLKDFVTGKPITFFDRSYGETEYMTKKHFTPQYIEKFDINPIYILTYDHKKNILESDFYNLETVYTSDTGNLTDEKYIILKATRNK
jgi:hypothetical protein